MLIEGTCHEFFAGSGFAANQHRHGSSGDPANFLVDGLHGPAISNDRGLGSTNFAHVQGFGHEPTAGDRFGHRVEHLRHVERFEQVIVSPQLGGFNSRLGGAKSGHHDNRQLRSGGVQLCDQVEARQAGHLQISDDDIPGFVLSPGVPFVTAHGHRHLVAFGLQVLLQGRSNPGIIFNEEYLGSWVHLDGVLPGAA